VHNVADVDNAFVQNLRPEAPAMDQTTHNTALCEVLQMLARLAETRATHEYRPDSKFTIDKMIERDTRCCDVSAGFCSGEPDPGPLPRGVDYTVEKCLNSLDFDQRDFASAVA
jgi:hypothetical protein